MEDCINEREALFAALKMQVIENIEFILKELDSFADSVKRLNTQPVYKTIFRLNLASFYERFGVEKTKLFRLTKTHYLENMPELCVVHAIPEVEADEDCALLIEDKMLISHQYLKNWLMAKDKDLYEKEILELVLSGLDMNIKHTSN